MFVMVAKTLEMSLEAELSTALGSTVPNDEILAECK
jgi:hypothetical protein